MDFKGTLWSFFVRYCFDEWFAVLFVFCARSHDPHAVLLIRQEKCQEKKKKLQINMIHNQKKLCLLGEKCYQVPVGTPRRLADIMAFAIWDPNNLIN